MLHKILNPKPSYYSYLLPFAHDDDEDYENDDDNDDGDDDQDNYNTGKR